MKPNILVFVTDQQRADWLSCMGNKILHTPNIDSIAAHGTCFTRAYCNTPLCMPSRYSMWTGLPASGQGLRTNGINPADVIATLPGILKDNGYRTVSVGKIHLRPWNLTPALSPNITDYDPDIFPECDTVWRQGLRTAMPDSYFGLERIHFIGGHGCDCFGEYANDLRANHPDIYQKLITKESESPTLRPVECYYSTVPEELYYDRWIEQKTIDEISACPKEKSFFIWCSFPDPHFPFGPPAPYSHMFSPNEIPAPIAWEDDRRSMNELYHKEYYQESDISCIDGGPTDLTLEQVRETAALAYGMVKGVDDSIGRIMNHLEATGRRKDTVVVFLSDHGELMGDHGLYRKGPFHYEGLLRIPYIISAPGMKRNQTCHGLASILDLMPTLLELAGVEYPAANPPSWPGLQAGKDIYAQVPRLPGRSLVPILSGNKNSVRDSVLVENDDDVRGVNLRTLITEQYKLTVYGGRDYGELFDLKEDQEERYNRWNDPAYKDTRASLMQHLVDALIENQNRLLRRIGSA